MAAEWFYKLNGTDIGPVSSSDLVELAVAGKLAPGAAVRKGDGPWVAAETVPGLADRVGRRRAEPPPLSAASAAVAEPRGRGFAMVSASAAEAFEVLDSAEDDGFRVEILAYPRLGGSRDAHAAQQVFFANRAGMKLKQVRITLKDGQALSEAGALHFMLGALRMESKVGGVGGIGRAMMNRFLTKEAAFLPRYHGTGQIYLEPSFSHFFIHRLAGEEVIADKGLFYCCDGALEVGAAVQKSISSALFGGEGWFQTRIRGRGLCVLESPVPADEIIRVDLKNETLQVDGNFALMRTGRIDFTVERSTKSLMGVFTSGELLLQTFRGVGSVWLAPTQDVYERLREGGHSALALASRNSSTSTESR
ncbi:AIM24 family protein [Paludisphaera borealis]|uniref:GYF domain-containing protein n=1 Tax=Paludisphaera borealis TaxID=1387353 RepID=A0A1U7CQ71_9BACT|nr:AIM24 family protein [Paludisphaera borealis]APW61059.1 hypothetical protein BSF38_02562 [Paludisphaera borealis]